MAGEIVSNDEIAILQYYLIGNVARKMVRYANYQQQEILTIEVPTTKG
jgi:hypothetical protein